MESTNYALFKYFKDNRAIHRPLVHQIMESIGIIGYIKGKPIVVDENLFIIDGQHRFEACKALHLPVIYEQESELISHEAITLLNKTQRVWQQSDYIHLHAVNEVPGYQELTDFKEKYKLSFTGAITIFVSGTKSASFIRKGLAITPNIHAEDIMDFLHYSKEYLPFWSNNKFIRAVTVLFNKSSFKDINRLKAKIMIIPFQANTTDYLTMFSNILSKGRRDGINL